MVTESQKMSHEENVAFIKSCAKFSATYATFSSHDFLFFISAWLLVCTTFSRCFFLYFFFSAWDIQNKKDSLEWGINEIWNKRGSCSKFLLADINKFLSSLYCYKLVKKEIIFQRYSFIFVIWLILHIFFFLFFCVFKQITNVLDW